MFIPAGSDRLNLLFTILITMSVYQMITADITPKGSSVVPILSLFILLFIVLIDASAMFCMFLIQLDKIKETGHTLMQDKLWFLTKWLIRLPLQ